MRLTNAAAIIRQDRANFHRFGIRDEADQWDSFFSSMENRAIAERMLNNGSSSYSAEQAIVNGPVLVHVQIYGRGSTGTSLNVTVLD